jgi:cell division control protein 6
LQTRVEQAFQPGTVPSDIIETLAEQVAERSGDCREALQTLLETGRKAEENGDRTLSTEYLENVSD